MGIKCSHFHDHLPGQTRTTYVEIRRSVENETPFAAGGGHH